MRFAVVFSLLLAPLVASAAIPEVATSSSATASSPSATSSETIRVDHRADWEQYLRQERSLQIQRLQAYAAAGVFPRNADVQGFGHQFLDADDHPCAVANLIWQSGHEDLVRETARTNNGVLVGEVTEGPLLDWVATSGLTREEVAIIQAPAPYEPMPTPVAQLAADQVRVQSHLAAALAVLQADTDSSIALALDRLGDRVYTAPPSSVS